jgi:hypothetical protein
MRDKDLPTKGQKRTAKSRTRRFCRRGSNVGSRILGFGPRTPDAGLKTPEALRVIFGGRIGPTALE